MSVGFDPFSEDPDEAPVTEEPTESAPKKTTRTRKTTTTKPKETTVSENVESKSKLSITLKGGGGFDAPWVVLYPETLEEARELLGEENRPLLKEILEGTQKAAAYFVSQAPEKPAAAPSGGGGGGGNRGGYSPRGGAPQGATEHPKGKTSFCEHGQRIYKTGTIKTGKNAGNVYHAFDCPQNECKREWDN